MMLGDAIIAVVALVVTVLIRRYIELDFTEALLPPEKFELSALNRAIVAGSFLLALAASGFYDQRITHRSRPALTIAAALQIALIAVIWLFRAEPLPRTVVLGTVLFELPLFVLWRRFVHAVLAQDVPPPVLVGSVSGLRAFYSQFEDARAAPPAIEGIISPAPPGIDGVDWWGRLDDPEVLERLAAAEEVILVSDHEMATEKLRIFAARGARGFLLLPSTTDALAVSSDFGWLGDQPVVEVCIPFGFGLAAVVKRAFDLAGALLLALLSLPVWLAAALAIAIESGRPILLRQPRVGRGGAVFGMWKFRTMRRGPNGDDSTLARVNDDRVTRTGTLLRRYRFDELPQLLNVLRGDMSLVGPRPEQAALAAAIVERLPEFSLRTMVRPGIAGLAQVSSDYHTSAAVKLRYDLTYMRDWSFWLDLRILARTIATVLSGRGL